jgi:hypothetical protein
MKIPKLNSKWWGGNSEKFRILSIVEQEGKTWVHYVKENSVPAQEYSCYLESFLERFSELPE